MPLSVRRFPSFHVSICLSSIFFYFRAGEKHSLTIDFFFRGCANILKCHENWLFTLAKDAFNPTETSKVFLLNCTVKVYPTRVRRYNLYENPFCFRFSTRNIGLYFIIAYRSQSFLRNYQYTFLLLF